MTDYAGEQEMEIEALRAILMDDFQDAGEDSLSGINVASTSGAPWFQIVISPKGDDEDEPTDVPVRMALFFSHTPKYPDEKPALCVRSVQGVRQADIDEIQAKLEEEAEQSLGMSMIYTLVTMAKDWLRERYNQQPDENDAGDDEEEKEEVLEAQGLPVTPETFAEWRERYDAEIALERAKLLPASVLAASTEKRLTGREWFAQRALKGVAAGADEDVEGDDEEDLDYDDDDFDDEDVDEEELLEHYLEQKGEKQ